MFAHDLCHNQIEYFRNAIDINRKDRATRGASACAARAIPQIFNLQSSIFNPACPGWVYKPMFRYYPKRASMIYFAGHGNLVPILFKSHHVCEGFI
jgi:hypothetical protein